MKFVDSASIRIEAGKGGAGCLGFVEKNISLTVALTAVMAVMAVMSIFADKKGLTH